MQVTGALEGQHKVAWVTFRFGSKKLERLVIVDEEEKYPLICLFAFKVRDKDEWDFFGKLFHGTEALREANPEPVRVAVKVVTRQQARELAKEERSDPSAKISPVRETVSPAATGADAAEATVTLTAVEEAETPSASSETEEVGDSDSGEEPEVATAATENSAQEDNNTAAMEQGLSEAEGDGNLRDGEWEKIMSEFKPLEEGDEKSEFVRAVEGDESLKVEKELADRREQGYKWRNGVLIQHKLLDWEHFGDVLVVPKSHRERILKVAHEKGGHLSSAKVLAMVKKRFQWPGMAKQISQHCKSCTTCQLHNKYPPRKAPLVERPILTEPFEALALDLVGPMKKGRGGLSIPADNYLACQ